ncbi:MAG: DUF4173 domain-containing protein [Lachnospiraceae bacterium]|nr:DUF4173 domain-containing protein [Lachnospiraceae bacterium]
MDNQSEDGLVQQPSLQRVQQADFQKLENRQKRFRALWRGSVLYALFYTVCLYHNASGITYPFFAGGTLWFYGFLKKKCACLNSESAFAEGQQNRAHMNKVFFITTILIAGFLNCTTDSGVLIFFNKLLMFVLMSVLMLQCLQDLTAWSITAYIKNCAAVLSGAVGSMFTPIGDLWACWKLRPTKSEKKEADPDRKRIWTSVGIGLLIAVPIAMFITILLASADAVFCKMVYEILTFSVDLDIIENIWSYSGVLLNIGIVFALCYGLFTYSTASKNIEKMKKLAASGEANLDTYIAITVNGIMCVIYLLFSGVQIFGLFLGKMKLPEGYTYSAYARRGFFELVFVCLFNILMVLFTMAYFKGSKTLKILLTVICGCTYIMTVSSAYRMILYISTYQLTFLRVLVLWGLAMIAVVMTGVVVYIYNQKFALFRFLLVVVTVGWLGFSAAHPDYWIASYNIAACSDGEEYDNFYLANRLSLDAVPALPEEVYNQYGGTHYWKRARKYQRQRESFLGIRAFNFSRAYAAPKIDNPVKNTRSGIQKE